MLRGQETCTLPRPAQEKSPAKAGLFEIRSLLIHGRRRAILPTPITPAIPAIIKAQVPGSGSCVGPSVVTLKLPVAPTLAAGEIDPASQLNRRLSTFCPETTTFPLLNDLTSVGITV